MNSETQAGAANPANANRNGIDYQKSLDCVHCGLCINSCPTYRMSGHEDASPRGRVYLMRGLAEGRIEVDEAFLESMDSCLVCQHCESVCPAGVEFGAMMESTREALETIPLSAGQRRSGFSRLMRRLGFERVLVSRSALKTLGKLLRFAQWTGLTRAAAFLLGRFGRDLAHMPALPPNRERGLMPERQAAQAEQVGRVMLLEGCVMPELFGQVNRATALVLTRCGQEVCTAPGHVCCGALHAHNGELQAARRLARETIAAFETGGSEESPIVVNSAGCGAHMHTYPALLREDPEWSRRADRFAARLQDLTQFLTRPAMVKRLQEELSSSGEQLRVTYDAPCHLCHAQGIRSEPRQLLDALPGVLLVEMESSESCCGSAGIYSLLRPKESEAILAPKLDELERAQVERLVTANPGCHLQWATGVSRRKLGIHVQHIAELIAQRLN